MLRVNKTSQTQKESSSLDTRQKRKKEKLLFIYVKADITTFSHLSVSSVWSSSRPLSSCVILTIKSTWKDHFMFCCHPRGFGQLAYHLLCLNPVTKPFVILFFSSRFCLVWAHFKDQVSDEQVGISLYCRYVCVVYPEESRPFFCSYSSCAIHKSQSQNVLLSSRVIFQPFLKWSEVEDDFELLC